MKSKKWETSTKLEKEWWTKWKNRTDLNLARKELVERADHLQKIIHPFYPDATRRILQIGPAANGEIHFLSGERYAIDPLASYFKANFPEFIDPRVRFIEGMAENLPYPDSFFDIVLILNVVDHCSDPVQVLEEISRCLHKNGVLIVHVNLYRRAVSVLHSIFNFLDREHPHALTYKLLRSYLIKHFDLLEESFLPLNLPVHDKRKLPVLIVLKALHTFPVYYHGIFKRR
jgi:SAM-dependent methyltransferase